MASFDLFTELTQWFKDHDVFVEVTPELAKDLARNGSYDHLSYTKEKNRFEICGYKTWIAEIDHNNVIFTCKRNTYHCSRPVPKAYIAPEDIFHEWNMI